MPSPRAVEVDEVPTVESQHGPTLVVGKGQDLRIADPLVALASLLDSEQVMTSPPQLDDYLMVEVLVSIEPSHPSRFLVSANGLVNLSLIVVVVGPSHVQVVLAQVGVA